MYWPIQPVMKHAFSGKIKCYICIGYKKIDIYIYIWKLPSVYILFEYVHSPTLFYYIQFLQFSDQQLFSSYFIGKHIRCIRSMRGCLYHLADCPVQLLGVRALWQDPFRHLHYFIFHKVIIFPQDVHLCCSCHPRSSTSGWSSLLR